MAELQLSTLATHHLWLVKVVVVLVEVVVMLHLLLLLLLALPFPEVCRGGG